MANPVSILHQCAWGTFWTIGRQLFHNQDRGRVARHPSLWRDVFRIRLRIPTISGIRDGRQRITDCGISATKEVKQSCENDENY